MIDAPDNLEPIELTPIRPDPPRLRIHHLMVCAAVAALQLSLWRAGDPEMIQRMSVVNAALFAAYRVLAAIGLTLAIFSIYWQQKGYAALVQPGQYLLLGYLVASLGFFYGAFMALIFNRDWLYARGLSSNSGPLASSLSILYFLVSMGLPLVFFLWCAWKAADTIAWRVVFVVLAISTLLYFVPSVTFALGFSSSPLTAIALTNLGRGVVVLLLEIWAISEDVTRLRTRFWTHWAGAGLVIASQLLTIAGGVTMILTAP
jgi:hypothetical protein